MKIKITNIIFVIMFLFSYSLKLNSNTKQLPFPPNSDYIFRGYNTFYSDFISNNGIDQGFQAPIFMTSYDENLLSYERLTLAPDGYRIINIDRCYNHIFNDRILGEKSYSDLMDRIYITTGTPSEGKDYIASTTFNYISEEIHKKQKIFFLLRAECTLYHASILVDKPPRLHRSFIRAIIGLSNISFWSNPSAYWRLFNNFGTHFITTIVMGARFGALSKTSQEGYSRIMTRNDRIPTYTEFEELFSVFNNPSNADKSILFSYMEEIKFFSNGGKPEDSNINNWKSKIKENPMPHSMKLSAIYELFNGTLKIDRSQLNGIDFNFLSFNLKLAYDNYCFMELLPNKKVFNSCSNIRNDIRINMPGDFSPGNYYLKNSLTGQCITSTGFRQTIVGLECGSNSNQQGLLFMHLNPKYRIIFIHPNLVFDLVGGNHDDNARIAGWDNGRIGESAWQEFDVIDNIDGTITIRSARGKCLQTLNNSFGNHTPIVQMSCNNSREQKWIFIRIHDVNAMRNGNYLQSIRR